MQLAKKKPCPPTIPGRRGNPIENLSVRIPYKNYGGDHRRAHEREPRDQAGRVRVLVGPSGCGRRRFCAPSRTFSSRPRVPSPSGARRPADPAPEEVRHRVSKPGSLRLAHRAQNVCMPMELMGLPNPTAQDRLRNARTGRALRLGRKYPAQLTGGMQQR
jgi:ABC-type taurine transport system ATPase subunit